jgi:hypothetical protein
MVTGYQTNSNNSKIRYSERSNNGDCPICHTRNSRCVEWNGVNHCKSTSPNDTIAGWKNLKGTLTGTGCSMWVPDTFKERTAEERREWGRKKREAERERERANKERRARAATPEIIDREYRQNYTDNPISSIHRQRFIDRGLSDADIERITAYTVGNKLILPIPNYEGLLVGAQIKIGAEPGYIWDRTGNNRTKKHDELPIAVWGNRANPERILFVEGVTFKPYITSLRYPSDLVIGASGGNFSGSSGQIGEILAQHPGCELILYPDAGASFNRNIRSQYYGLRDLVGDTLSVAWWNQYDKSDGDIDEIDIDTTEIKYLEWYRYARILDNGTNYITLNKSRLKPDELRSERYLDTIWVPDGGTMLFVSSPMGTGKTEQLKDLCDRWERVHPDGRILLVSYRNGLLDQTSNRLGIDSYRTGHGYADAYINSAKRIAIVADSSIRLNLDDVPDGTLLVLDEAEAVLNHIAGGETTKSRYAAVQNHFSNLVRRIVSTGGAVIALQDNLTDIAIEGLCAMGGDIVKRKIIKNQHQIFNWDVSIADGSSYDFSELLLSRLKNGERIVLPTTSQKYGEKIERLVSMAMPELASKIERVDSKTLIEQRELIANPVEALQSRGTRLLILSPTIESGFSVDDKHLDRPLFDRVMMYAPNLDARTQMQMLGRYRSNCPRDIFIRKRGCDTKNAPLTVDGLKKQLKTTANQTSLAQGFGRIENSPTGELWNDLYAKFVVRANLCKNNALYYLRHDLIEAGHNVGIVDWSEAASEYRSDNNIDLNLDIKSAMGDIEKILNIEESTALDRADGTKMSLLQAQITMSRSDSTQEQRTVASKTLLHHELPGIQLGFDLIHDVVVVDRKKFIRQCELAYFLDVPELAHAIDRINIIEQHNGAHILYNRVAKCEQKYNLLYPIWRDLQAIGDGREYMAEDELIISTAAYCRKRSGDFLRLFGITCSKAHIGSNGGLQNSDIAIVNKILRLIGKEGKKKRQIGSKKARKSIYAASDRLAYRDILTTAIATKHAQTIERSQAIQVPDLSARHTVFSNKDTLILKTVCLDNKFTSETAAIQSEWDLFVCEVRAWMRENMSIAHTLVTTYSPEVIAALLNSSIEPELKAKLTERAS